MPHTDSREQSQEYGRSAIELMEQRGVPLNPANFAVWYAYVAGKDPDLIRGLDVLISNKVNFSPDRNQEIYDQYFGNTISNDGLLESGSRLQIMVEQVMTFLDQGSADQAKHCESLANISEDLAGASQEGAMTELVKGILAETAAIVNSSRNLHARLGVSSQEIAGLRRHLVQARQEAMTDALTGISNRKFLELRLDEEAESAMETGQGLCLLLLDIDHFKRFNDTYGHRIGDEVLKVTARVLKESVKGRDIPARYGGEEFCVLLPQTELRNAAILAEQIRATLANRELTNRSTGRSYGRITLSIGVASYRYGEALAEFVHRADEALYRAKRDGRNLVEGEARVDDSLSLAG